VNRRAGQISRRFVILGAAVCAVLALSAAFAGTALANRGFETRIHGFDQIGATAVDGQDNVWVTDGGEESKENPGNEGVYKYAPYPSQTRLSIPNTYESFGYYIFWLQPAVDEATGNVLVAQSNGRTLNFFAPRTTSPVCKNEEGQAETYCWTHQWTRINGANTCFNCNPDMHVAVDNSGTFSEGRVYLALSSPENDIEVFDDEQRPVAFPATAPYITKYKLTGTPSGNFGEVGYVAVDSLGNIYVTDWGKQVVDEFDSSGTFLRSFPSPRAASALGPATGGVAIDPTNGNVLITESAYNPETEEGGVREFDAWGNYLGTIHPPKGIEYQPQGEPVVNSHGYLYVPSSSDLMIFAPAATLPKVTYKPVASPTPTAGTLEATVDPNGGGSITECKFEYGTTTGYGTTAGCSTGSFSTTTDVSAPLSGLTTETTYHYRVVVHTASGVRYGEDQVYTPHKVVGLRTKAASNVGEAGATLNGEFAGNGEETHYHFEWGPTAAYGHSTTPAAVSPGNGVSEPLSAPITGLAPFSTYHFRVVANNGGGTSVAEDRMFTTPPGVPSIVTESVTVVHSDRAFMHGTAIANGAPTEVHFEYVADDEYQRSGFANAIKVGGEEPIGMGKEARTTTVPITGGLQPGTLYHYREVGVNEAGEGVPAKPHTFTTFAFAAEINDHCPNAHVRQQTSSALLLDCRAYELVSAASSGGYDVESNLVAGQNPFPESSPEAADQNGEPRVLYGVHDGGIPGFPAATNRGVDPYVATRTAHGWTTEYDGIPASGTPSTRPFSSSLLEADANLRTFAFGGPEICSPCFGDGSTGNPIHLPNGELVQGLAGSIPKPSAEPAGYIGKHLSADGTHFIFGSAAPLEPGANNDGDVNVYDRDLEAGTTHLASKTPAGGTLTGPGIGELSVSGDGSRIVVGQLVSEEGNAKLWHLYMNIGDSSKTIDLTPGTTHGVLFDGMAEDGSRVFFTSADPLTTATDQDSDSSPDLYEAEVNPSGTMTLSRVSTGTEGTGNGDGCHPSANTINPQWNSTVAGEENCGVVAVGGGGGVARGDGTVFFLSPEKLAGSSNGVQDAPNLYVVRPGKAPDFVATLESTSNAPLPSPTHPHLHTFGAFKNPTGVAVDDSTGDIYVLDAGSGIGQGYVYKFNPEGKPVFAFGEAGKLVVSGMDGFYNWPTQIAIDNDPASPNHGDLYVPEIDYEGGQFAIKKYSANGDLLKSIETFGPSGVGVDSSTGNVYVTLYPAGAIAVYNTAGEFAKVFFVSEHSPEPEGVSVDNGKVYVVNGGGPAERKGTTEVYNTAGEWKEQLDGNPSRGVAVDPSDGHVFVDEGSQVSEFDSSGNSVGVPAGTGNLHNSVSLDAFEGTIAVGNPSQSVAETYGPLGLPVDPQVDSPLVIDSVNQPGSRRTADFQVTPSGAYAAFTTTLPLTEYDNGAIHREVFRYDGNADALACASCNPTSEQATGESTLPANGLGLSDDGRVFFNSTEGLVDRDLNEGEDGYEWEPDGYDFTAAQAPCANETGCVQLLSTGNSQFASNLLGVSESGTDAYFFTREKLAEEDLNGNTVKIYDARSLGGYPFVPPEPQCKASDECHGAGTPIPPPPNIKSVAPTPGGNLTTPKCKHGKVRRHGRCVARRHNKKHNRSGHRGGSHHG
jgi:hypothetical protein